MLINNLMLKFGNIINRLKKNTCKLRLDNLVNIDKKINNIKSYSKNYYLTLKLSTCA